VVDDGVSPLTCAAEKALTKQHVADIRCKVKGLKRFQAILNNLAGQCHDDDRLVLDALTDLNLKFEIGLSAILQSDKFIGRLPQ
jgi:hypothetical protein